MDDLLKVILRWLIFFHGSRMAVSNERLPAKKSTTLEAVLLQKTECTRKTTTTTHRQNKKKNLKISS